MTLEEANREARKIFEEWSRKSDLIVQEAERDGRWLPGLDSNRGLFKELDEEMKEKLEILKKKVSE